MKRETLLTFSVVLLLLLNAGVITYLFVSHGRPHGGPGGHPHGPPVDQLIRSTLHFSAEQEKEFEKLKNSHHAQMVQLDKEYSDNLLQYFQLLKSDAADSASKEMCEKKLADIQVRKAQTTYRHFADLRALCTPEQRPAFETILPEIMRVIMPGPGPNGPPPPMR